jgi:signal transduction histidine kinase
MSTMDWPRVFHLLAHELRSPAAVIGGYARMLSGGRLNEDDRLQAYAQIERAASRITAIGQQSSDLARWLRPRARRRGADRAARARDPGAGAERGARAGEDGRLD